MSTETAPPKVPQPLGPGRSIELEVVKLPTAKKGFVLLPGAGLLVAVMGTAFYLSNSDFKNL